MTIQDVSMQLALAKSVYKRTLARLDAHLKGIIGRDPSMMDAARALQKEYATDLDGAVLIALVQPQGKEPEPVPEPEPTKVEEVVDTLAAVSELTAEDVKNAATEGAEAFMSGIRAAEDALKEGE